MVGWRGGLMVLRCACGCAAWGVTRDVNRDVESRAGWPHKAVHGGPTHHGNRTKSKIAGCPCAMAMPARATASGRADRAFGVAGSRRTEVSRGAIGSSTATPSPNDVLPHLSLRCQRGHCLLASRRLAEPQKVQFWKPSASISRAASRPFILMLLSSLEHCCRSRLD